MLFEDNFDTVALDTSKWSYQLYDGYQYGAGDWGNQELVWYTNSTSNVYQADGNLIINAQLDPNPDFLSYTLSKAALLEATRLLAQALAP